MADPRPAAPPPLLLALDTASAVASLALYDGQRVVAELTWEAGRDHSTQVLAQVQHLLGLAHRAAADLTGLAVACGPGSFTGVRVGLGVAKGLAAGLAVPAWGIGTLDVLAQAAGPVDAPVRAVLDVGRGRVATAVYREGVPVGPITTLPAADLAGVAALGEVLVGDLPPALRETLQAQPGRRVVAPAGSLRRAGFLAELAWLAAERGDPGNAVTLDAVYLAR